MTWTVSQDEAMPPALRPFRPDDVYLLHPIMDPRVSPDGRRVAYVLGTYDRDSDLVQSAIWVAPTDGSAPARPFSTGAQDASPRWSPDGRWLAFTGVRGCHPHPQLLAAPLDGGEPCMLSAHPHGVEAPAWSPDSRSLAYIAKVGDGPAPEDAPAAVRNAPRVVHDLYYRFDRTGYRDDRRSHVFVVDVNGGAPRQLTRGDFDDGQPAWSPDGSLIAFVSDRRADRWREALRGDIWVVPAAGGRARRLTRELGTASQPTFSPDGQWVAYVGSERGPELFRPEAAMLVPVGGEEPPRALVAGPDSFASRFGQQIAWPSDGDLLGLVPERGGTAVWACPPDGPAQRLTEAGKQLLAVDAAGGVVAVVRNWVDEPREVVTVASDQLGQEPGREVSSAHAELRRTVVLAGARRLSSLTADGTASESFLLASPGSASEPRPLVLDVHGGPHGCHPSPSPLTWAWSQMLTAAGYLVLQVNPRGSSSYGEEFQAACVGDWGGGDFADLMAAVDRVVETGEADPDRLYVMGYSYGGFMAAWAVGHTHRFRAASAGAPVIDQLSMLGTTDIPIWNQTEVGGPPHEVPDAYRALSPLTYADRVRTPLRLATNEADARTPIGQTEQMFAGLKLLGRDVVMVRHPGGWHGGLSPSQTVAEGEQILAWFAAH
jgi:dipeptidyl aminopeptidase/acylaminoacyl peptidase